jgi:diguanylate cyclase (GGDEF)-like protein/PAS domain S-box-containing protein
LVLSIRDISQQLLQERALQDSQKRLKPALEGAELGLWDWPLPSNQVFASTHAAQLHGLGSHTHSGPIIDFFKFTSAADQQNALQAFKKLRDGITNNFRVIYTVKQPGCAARHLESTAKLYRNSQGQPERMIGVINDISVRTLREQALGASEAKFTTLFHASPEPVSVSRLSDGAFLEVNPSFCQTFGWSAEQVIGKTALQINFWNDLELRLRLGKKLLDNGQVDEEIAEFRTQDGRVITCMFAGRLIFIGRRRCLLTTFRDITEQQQVQRALKLSEEKFAKAFFPTPYSISISERSSGRFIEVNAGFSDLTGYSAAEAIDRTSLQLNCWGNALERDQLLAMLARDGQVNNVEIEGRRRNGELITTEVSVAGININGVDCLLLIARDISALKQAQIQHMAYHDPLTNLPNRALLMDRLSQQIALLKRHNLRGALLFLDLDHFKHINDSLGHPLGDAVLKMIAARLEISIRQEDTVARLGGDEFVVLISELEGSRTDVGRQVRELANKLRRLLSEPMMLDGHRLQVTPSIGMVLIPDHGDRPDDLLSAPILPCIALKPAAATPCRCFAKTCKKPPVLACA